MQIAKTSYLKDIVSPKDINFSQKKERNYEFIFTCFYFFICI